METGRLGASDEVASEYQSKLGVKEAPSIKPAFTETIPYLVQYKESDYEFARYKGL